MIFNLTSRKLILDESNLRERAVWNEATMIPSKRNPYRLAKKQISIPLKPRSLAQFLCQLVFLGYMALYAVPSMADDLETAYQEAVSTSPVIAQARAQLDADLAGKPLARAAPVSYTHLGAQTRGAGL